MNRSLWTVALVAGLGGALPAIGGAEGSGTGMEGIWKLEQKSFAYSGVLYSTLAANGACSQVLKLKALGITHWGADRCSWSREQSVLHTTITAFPGSEDKVGTQSTVTIVSVDATTLVLLNEKKETQTYTRVPAIPDEFQAEFQKAFQPPAAKTGP